MGEAGPNWPVWYASYLVAEQAGAELPRGDHNRSSSAQAGVLIASCISVSIWHLDGARDNASEPLRAPVALLPLDEINDLGGALLGLARKAPLDRHVRHQRVFYEAVCMLL